MDGIPTSIATLRTDDGGSIEVLKDQLGECSEYFDTLFNGPLTNACRCYFLIPGVSGESLQTIVTYALTGDVDITVDNVEDLTIAADQLMVDDLLDECSAFMSRNLDVENIVMVLEMASALYLKSLRKPALSFLLNNFEQIYSENRDFSQLSMTNLADVLASNELKVQQEEVVWEATVFWIKANPTERGKCLGKLLPHIRFYLMKSKYLRKVVLRNPLVYKNPLYKTIIKRCHKIKLSGRGTRPKGSTRDMFVQRVPPEVMFVYGGMDRGYKSNTWETYDYKTGEWNTVDTDFRQDQVFGLQCVSIGHKIYVMGADITQRLRPFCYHFDVVAHEWSPISSMMQLRAFFGIAVHDGRVYCIGGSSNGIAVLDTAEEYDTTTGTWRSAGRMQLPRLGGSAASCAGLVYVVGGMSTDTILRSAEAYDPATNQWTTVAPMTFPRVFPGLVTYRDKVYAIGGVATKSIICEVYDPKSGTWSKSAKTKSITGKMTAVVLDDKIYAIGEPSPKDHGHRLEYFSGDDGKWHSIPGCLKPRWFYIACVVKNLPNTTDYVTRPKGVGQKFDCCNML